MDALTVSPKYQVVIPKSVREATGTKVGERLQVVTYGKRIELIPINSMDNLHGGFKGMNTDFQREDAKEGISLIPADGWYLPDSQNNDLVFHFQNLINHTKRETVGQTPSRIV